MPRSKGLQLIDACGNDNFDEAKALIEDEGVDVEFEDSVGTTPLIYATSEGKVNTMRLLLDDYGATIDNYNEDGDTAIQVSAWSGQDEAVKLLIERGADLHKKNFDNRTPLDNAKKYSNKSSTVAIIETEIKSIKGKND